MKKIFILFITLVLVIVTSGCSGLSKSGPAKKSQVTEKAQETSRQDNIDNKAENHTEGKMIKMTLYFTNSDNSALLPEAREILVKDGAIMRAAVNALIEGPENPELKQTIPEGTRLIGIKRTGNVAVVDFSKEYYKAQGIAEIVERASIVNTLTEIAGIDKVRILVEGKDLIGPSGNPLGEMSRFSLDSRGNPLPGEKKIVTVYFSNSNADKLVPEKREITVNKGDGLEKHIFQELAIGPKKQGLYPVIPQGTKLIAVTTKDGVCTVNLSQQFVDNNKSGTAGESMTIYSIVNSLTELHEVKKVQFLINGKKRDVYLHLVFDEPFTRNEDLIQK
ncbi:MAG: GerMN domain-containing protein [Clostridia bacterium]|nr:GerMN domain-containing protein [Clostridia bacterium]